MALTYREVRDIYDELRKSGAVKQSLPEWSEQMNRLTDSELYAAGKSDNLIKRASVGLDKLIEMTGVPAYAGEVGREVGAFVGDPEAGERIGASSGRMLANFAPLLIPGAGVPATAARLGGTALLSGAGAYTETDSKLAGVVAGGTAAVLPKVADVAGQMALKRIGGKLVEGEVIKSGGRTLEDVTLKQVSRYFPETIGQRVVEETAGQAAAAGAMEIGTAGQALVSGEEYRGPFNVETLLNLTLGQVPFALVHLGGRAVGLGKTPLQRADILQKAVEQGERVTTLKKAREELDNMAPIDGVPLVTQPTEVNPEVIKETQSRLSILRGEQLAVKYSDLDPEEKLNETNRLLREESLLLSQHTLTADTVLGNKIQSDAPRQDVLGTEIRRNKDGSWRAILVSDDPTNPEELRGKIVKYSTAYEKRPTRQGETGAVQFDLPDSQWRTVVTQDEWSSRYRKKPDGLPELPEQDAPATDEQIAYHMHELEKVDLELDGAQTTADVQEAMVHLRDVEYDNELSPTNDAKISRHAKKLIDSGLADPREATKLAVKAATKRAARKLTAKEGARAEDLAEVEKEITLREQERAAMPLSPERAARVAADFGEGAEVKRGFSVTTADKLLSHRDPEDFGPDPIRDIVTDTAMTVAKSPAADAAFKGWTGREDTTYAKDFLDFTDLVEQYGSLSKVPVEEAGKYLAERTGAVPWDKTEVTEFLNRPHVKIWATELDAGLARMQQRHSAPVPIPAIRVAGQKGRLLQNEQVNKVIEDFSKGQNIVDAFGGSGQLGAFAKGAGAKSVEVNIKEPRMRAVFDEIKNNTEVFIGRVTKAVEPIEAPRDKKPFMRDGSSIVDYLNNLEQSDPNLGLFLKQNLTARGNEVVAEGFHPGISTTKTGLLDLPNRIRDFASKVDTIRSEDGWVIVQQAGKDQRVLVDPPYVGVSNRYVEGGKITVEQRLKDYEQFLYPATERDANFVVFDSAEPALIKSLEDHGFTVDQVQRAGATKPELVARNTRPTSRFDRAEPFVPQTPEDMATIQKLGIDQGGIGLNNYLMNHSLPLLRALGRDFSKFEDSLRRTRAAVEKIDGGAYARFEKDGSITVVISDGHLRQTDAGLGLSVAHELVHGLTMHELANPTKAPIVEGFNKLRLSLVSSLAKPTQQAFNKLHNSKAWESFVRGEITYVKLVDDVAPTLSQRERSILYGMLDADEFVAQGLTSMSMRDFLKGVNVLSPTSQQGRKIVVGSWYHRFTNLVKQLLGINDGVISNTAFEEFLSHTDQLMQQGDYVANFRDFSERYFQNLGMSDQQTRFNTQRALGLILDTVDPAMTREGLVYSANMAGSFRSPEWAKADREVRRMVNEKGEDWEVSNQVLDELGLSGVSMQDGLNELVTNMMLGNVPKHIDALDVLPERATRYLFESLKDTKNIFGVIESATNKRNKGILNIADPNILRGPIKETLKDIEKVLSVQQAHELALTHVQGLFSVPPDGYINKVRSAPDEALPEWVAPKRERDSWIKTFLEPIGQLVKRIPEAAEAFSRGWQLNANSRKMATESLKAFATDLKNMEFSKESVAAVEKTLRDPRLEKVINNWIYTNQIEGKKAGKVTLLDRDHPEIQKLLNKLSTKDRDDVEDVIQKHQISQQHMQDQILEKMLQIASTNGAVIAQKDVKGKLSDSVTLSDTLLRAVTADRTDPNVARQADSQIDAVQKRMTPEGFNDLLGFTLNQAEKWQAHRQFFQENPAWSSGQRYGKYLLTYKKNGRTVLAGVDSTKERDAMLAGGGRLIKFEKNQWGDDDVPPLLGPDSTGVITRMRELRENELNMLRKYFSPEDIQLMSRFDRVEQFATEEAYRGGIPGLDPQPRGLTKGAEELPWLSNHMSWVHKTANHWSRQLLRAQSRAHLLDPEIASNEQLRAKLKQHYDNVLQPDTRTGQIAQRTVMTWFMGFNPASAMINATQPFLTHVAELTAMTGKPLDSYRRTVSSLKDIVNYHKSGKKWSDPDIEWMMRKAHQDGELDYSMYDDNAGIQEAMHVNLKRAMSGNRTQSLGQRLSTVAGNVSNTGMWMFRGVERMNNMAALLSSYKYFRESQPNMGRNEAYAKAVEFNHAVNFGGGRAQRPIGAFAGEGAFPRTAAMLATSMQSYVLGTTFQIARYIQQGYFRPAGLTPHEIFSARKAAVQMLGTQLAAAGVLGLPFVSGAIAALDKLFPDLELNRHLRETMNDILGGDEENGHVLSDIAMTGAPSMMGWDLQSRLTMGNTVPGVSEVNGFEPERLLGAPANLVTNFIKGGKNLATGQFGAAADSFMPAALKKISTYLRSGGQVLDYRDRPLFQPTAGEVAGIALGFQPKRLTDINAASRMADQAQENITRQQGQFHQELAGEVLKGNFGTVQQTLRSKIQEDKNYDAYAAIRAIAKSAEELTFPRDLRSEGTVRAGGVREKLLRTFNLPASQPTEVQRAQFRLQIQQRLGLVAERPTDLRQAQLVDQLRQSNPDASRAELRRQASRLLRVPRPQTLAEPLE